MSMFIAPVAGRTTDKIGGKYILMSGLILFGVGMGWLALIAHPASSWPVFLAPLIVAGIGMGCIFAPMVTVAMRNIDPRVAGAASGVLNTARQVGAAVGAAVVGAVLQNRLVHSLHTEAVSRSTELPPAARGQFVSGFDQAASNGLQLGSGQSGGVTPPPGLPASLSGRFTQLVHDTFGAGFMSASRPTLVVVAGLLVLGSVLALFLTSRPKAGKVTNRTTAVADSSTKAA